MNKCIVCNKEIVDGYGMTCTIKNKYKAHAICWLPLNPQPKGTMSLVNEKERTKYAKEIEEFTDSYLKSKGL